MRLVFIILLFHFSSWAVNIVVDPGHGGNDKGAVYGKAQESKVVYDISMQLKELLLKNKYEVSLTRNKDEFVSLKKRVEISQEKKADLFVSLHANATEDRRAKGIEFFLQPPKVSTTFAHKDLTDEDLKFTNESTTDDTISLSKKADIKKIISDLHQQIKLKKSISLTSNLKKDLPGVIKQAPFYVLTRTQVPSVLIEVGFLSHPKENKKLLSEEYQKHLAEKIYSSIENYNLKLSTSANSLDENKELPK